MGRESKLSSRLLITYNIRGTLFHIMSCFTGDPSINDLSVVFGRLNTRQILNYL